MRLAAIALVLATVAGSAGAVGVAPHPLPAGTPVLRTLIDGEVPGLPGWRAHLDPASGLPQRIYGAPAAMTAEEFVRDHARLLGVDPASLVARPAVTRGRFTVVVLDQRWHGYAVEGARVELRFTSAGLSNARVELARDLGGVAPAPALSAADAERLAVEAVRESGRTIAGTPAAGEPLVVRAGDRWRLALPVHVDASNPPGSLTVSVDALDGRALGIRDAFVYDTPTPLSVTGVYEPRRAGDPLVSAPYSFVSATAGTDTLFADSSGVATFAVPPGGITASLRLDASFLDEAIYASSSQSIALVPLSPGVPASFEWDGASATLAERDLFQHRLAVHARHKAMAPDIAWVDSPLRYTLEIADPTGCNAYWDGISGVVNLFAESSTCNDTARVADVVYHETTHGLHQHLSATGFVAADVGEGSADYVSATINGDPEIGASLLKDNPAGIRNLEPDRVWPGDFDGEPHNDGLIWGGAFWDLRTRFIAALGSSGGVALTDRLLADTLRLDPTLDDGFWDVLFADDDDGDLTNGTPHLCDVVQTFGAHGLGPGNRLAVFHVPLGPQPAEASAYRIRARVSPTFPACGSSALASLTLSWRLSGTAAWTTTVMQPDTLPGWRVALIPAQHEGAGVEYRITAVDSQGRLSTAPISHPETQPLTFPVGSPRRLFFDDFESDRGWSHRAFSSQFAGSDDWERGTPRGRSGDPLAAFSGTFAWGNDLGTGGTDGGYPGGARSRLSSPEIDCGHASGVHLRFRRWLNVQAAPADNASIFVNGHLAWTNPVGEDVRDREWKLEDVDLSPWADGRNVRVEFELRSDNFYSKGGWTIDDVEVVASGSREPVQSCDAVPGARGTPGIFAALLLLALLPRARRSG